ncbi:MAG: LytTR family DNA-binding domain-containing protein [Acetivibrio sp.]
MQIALCDDDSQDLEYINQQLENYKRSRTGLEWEIIQYSSSEKLCQEIQEGKKFDLYLLDIWMPEKTGIDIGRLIRSEQERGEIIFITASKEHALEAFDVQAVRYLLKPVKEEVLFEAMDFAISLVTREEPRFFFKTNEGIHSIPYSQIEYLECASRTIQIKMTNGKTESSIFIRQSFETEVEELLQTPNFLQTHKSYVVNMEAVEIFSAKELKMKSGMCIPISKNRQTEVKRRYLEFFANQYR